MNTNSFLGISESSSPDPGGITKPPGQPSPLAGADIHALLCEKIAALQAERQSRWQKIINFLAGKQSGQPVP